MVMSIMGNLLEMCFRLTPPVALKDLQNFRFTTHTFLAPLFSRRAPISELGAAKTCELAGFAALAEVDPDPVEWDYGEYEGRRGIEIRTGRPDWNLFRDRCPGGESPAQVAARAERVISRVRALQGDVLLFTSGYFIRVLAASWIGLEPKVAAGTSC
jgi:broad specificity phosphatase PhoE